MAATPLWGGTAIAGVNGNYQVGGCRMWRILSRRSRPKLALISTPDPVAPSGSECNGGMTEHIHAPRDHRYSPKSRALLGKGSRNGLSGRVWVS